jgi:enamine deaminase RidA (YjgF/YER057c/UK114 family)
MGTIDDRLAELGLTLPTVVPPVAAYVPAVVTGNLVYTSGQLPMVDGVLPATGKLGRDVDDAEGKRLARQCALNALAAVASVIGSLDRVTNGASEVLGEIFGDAGVHARSAVGVAVLPLDSPVEVELIVEFA